MVHSDANGQGVSGQDKRERLAALLRDRLTAPVEFPLSFNQRSLWFLHRLNPANTAYNVPLAWRIVSPLDIAALRRAFEALVARHPILRTTYNANEPIQRVHGHQELDFGLIEAARWTQHELDARIIEEFDRPFDLQRGAVLRIRLFERSSGEYLLLVTFHHIAYDLWSLMTFISELGTLYASERAGTASELPLVAGQYSDFVRWQAEMLAADGERLWSYWEKRLSGDLPVLDFPTDRPRPSVQTYRGAVHSWKITAPVAASLHALARAEGVTIFTVLLAAYQVLLFRYTGQSKILVGSPMVGRTRPEFENLVGYCLNLLPLAAEFSGDPDFRTLVREAHSTVCGALEHQDFPLELLVDRLKPARSTSHPPLFQTVFVLNRPHVREGQRLPISGPDGRAQRSAADELTLETVPIAARAVQFDVALHVDQIGDSLAPRWEYNRDLFHEATAARWAAHFTELLAGIIADPTRRQSELPMAGASERQQVLREWNATRRAYPQKGLAAVFEEQAARTPTAIALECEAATLTYAELNARANQLAHYLRRADVSADTLVGVCLDRSIELIVAVLGIVKAGGAYVPLDPSYPVERLAFMVRDAKSPVVVTTTALRALMGEANSAHVVRLDAEAAAIAAEPATDVATESGPEHLAYVTYTSGSTGVPKGVAVRQRGVLRLVFGGGFAELGPEKRLLQLAPVAFDASTLEIWGALLQGGCCVIYPQRVPTAAELGRVLQQHRVTTLWLTASLFNAVIDEAPEALRGVRQLLIGGEALSVPHVRRALVALPDTDVINGYGPTESTTFTCCDLIARDLEESAASVPIGRPIGNTSVYVLDSKLSPQPVGVTGELYIGGDGLARGYHNRSALTAERFVPDPFADTAGARMYRTADLVRWRSDGRLDFLGRIDDQVKIRGFRIELGEIDTVLKQHPLVGDAVVAVREDVPGDRRLVAYIVKHSQARAASADDEWEAEGLPQRCEVSGTLIDDVSHAAARPAAYPNEPVIGTISRGVVPELRAHLAERLPEYMLPSAFVQLDALPLTANGKIDRRRLPAPDTNRPDVKTAFVPARSPIEAGLAEIWGGILGLVQVGAHDHFFEIGGHSLLATQVISRVRDVFQIELPFRAFFENPTIAALAPVVEDALRQGARVDQPAIQPAPRSAPLPLSFAQQRLWLVDQIDPHNVAYNMPSAFRLRGSLDADAFRCAIREVVRRHEVLRTTFPAADGRPEQQIHPAATWDLHVLDLREGPVDVREATALEIARHDAHGPFDLDRGPLFRATLVRLAPEDHLLVLNAHHSVFDGWSIGIFTREVAALYDAFSQGRSSPLPELALQYVDFACWQREWLRGEQLARTLEYWKRHLAGIRPLDLLTDRPRPAVQTSKGAVELLPIPRALADAVKALGQREGTTLFMTMLAVFVAALFRRTGQEDIIVGSAIAGRSRSQIEDLIGFFVNTVALRVDVDGESTFRQLLGRVRRAALEAYAHQDVPFEKLVEELQVPRDSSRNPIFQVFFNVFDLSDGQFALPGLDVEAVPITHEASKFDLTLFVYEGGGAMTVVLTYNPDLFDAETIRRFGAQFQVALEAVVHDPGGRLGELPLMQATETADLIGAFNAVLE